LNKEQSLDVAFVFVDGGDKSLYQIRQWLQPLERLSSTHSIKVYYFSPFVAKELSKSSLKTFHFLTQEQLTDQLYKDSPKVMLYPNQNVRNFHALRYPEAVHVFVSHGESDKAYMSQNTVKRYDLYFAAGEAAVDRISEKVVHYDHSKRILQIGRPQSKDQFKLPADFHSSNKKRILYAPTWEGVTRATRYSSIESHGKQLVAALMSEGSYQLTYRPHPLSGSRDSNIKKHNDEIKKLIKEANKKDPTAKHYVDKSTFGWQLDYHQLMISDISAIAYDWLSTGHPILLTKPADKKAIVEEFPLVEKLHSITVKELSDASSFQKLIASQYELGQAHQGISEDLNKYYFRQPTSQSDQHLKEAIEKAISIQQEQIANKEFPRLQGFVSRGGTLGLLRYPNFAIREAMGLLGNWSSAGQLAKCQKTDQVYLHLSDPFNGKSLEPSLAKLLAEKTASEDSSQLVLVTNQVSSLLQAQKLLKLTEYSAVADSVIIVPVANASDCENVVSALSPKRAIYLKHHPLNHMMLRLNGLEHALWKPELDPFFEADHSIITYDYLVSKDPRTLGYLELLPRVSRPGIMPS
jgi:hypothetical protein